MNREQKAAAIEEVAGQIQEAEAVFAVDYRGISVPQAAELRTRLTEAGARFRVVKNTLTMRAADQAGAESLKEVLEGPTAFTFVLADGGDVALAAKALATFRREHDVVAFKGGLMNGDALTVEQLEALSRLPARDVLHGQLVGMIASPITGLVRVLNALISGLAIQLGQIRDQGLVGGDAAAAEEAPAEEAAEETPATEAAEAPAEEAAEEPPATEAAEAPAEEAAEEAPAEPADEAGSEEAATEEAPAEPAKEAPAEPAEEAPSEEAAAEEAPAEPAGEAPSEEAAAEEAPAEPAEDAAADEAPAEEAADEESAAAGDEEAPAEEAPAEPEAEAEGDGTETDATDAPSEGDEKE
jgi:large subunit ribosomal protein L10